MFFQYFIVLALLLPCKAGLCEFDVLKEGDTEAQERVETDKPDEPDTLQPLKPGELSPEGFGKTKWGMSPAQVRRAYPGGQFGTEYQMTIYTVSTTVVKRSANIQFGFAGKQLAGVIVNFSDIPNFDYTKAKSDFDRVASLLTRKYGEADWNRQEFPEGSTGDYIRDNPEMWDMGYMGGNITFDAMWIQEETSINLESNQEYGLRILYIGMRMIEAYQRAAQDAQDAKDAEMIDDL